MRPTMSHSASPREWYRTASSTPRSCSPSARARPALAGPWRSSGGPGESAAHVSSSSADASRNASCSHTARSHRCFSESGTPICSAHSAASRATLCMCSSRLGVTTAHSGRVGLSSASTKALRQVDIVDQPSAAYPGRHGDNSSAVRDWNWAEAFGLDDGNVLHPQTRLSIEHLAHALLQFRSLTFAFTEAAVGGEQCAAEGQGLGAFAGIQVGIPAAQGEPVRLANGRYSDQLDGPVEISYHSPDQGQLLDVFLPEAGQVRLHEVKQLGHNRENTGEMPGPGCAFPPFRRCTRSDPHLGTGRVHQLN